MEEKTQRRGQHVDAAILRRLKPPGVADDGYTLLARRADDLGGLSLRRVEKEGQTCD